jgi:hypothetical protein
VDVPALLRAAEVKVKGIVVGGIHASLAELAPKLPFPVVITEGLGHIPMAGVIFDLLRANEGEEASLSGQMDDHGEPIRPEVVIFSAARHDVIPAANDSQLKEGVTVRIVREPYIGKVGTVKALPRNVRVVDSGLVLLGAEVDLHSGDAIFVPINNLELIR